MLMQWISSLLKVFCCIIYLKCFKRKITKLSDFYYVVEELNATRYIKNKKLLGGILVTFDFSIPVYFLIFHSMDIYFLVFVLFFQTSYLIEMITRKEK